MALSACRRGQGERRRVVPASRSGLACLGGLLAPSNGRAGYRQTERRVLKGETVPAAEKLVSLADRRPHRSTSSSRAAATLHYGHKLNLTSGKSGMILDVVIQAGNPADARALAAHGERHIDIYGRPPRQMAADGDRYARAATSRPPRKRASATWRSTTKRGAEDRRHGQEPLGLSQAARYFRAGIEAGISCLKRAYGLRAAPGRAWPTSRPTSGPRLVAYNLALCASPQAGIARLTTARETGRRPALARMNGSWPRTPTATTTYYPCRENRPSLEIKSRYDAPTPAPAGTCGQPKTPSKMHPVYGRTLACPYEYTTLKGHYDGVLADIPRTGQNLEGFYAMDQLFYFEWGVDELGYEAASADQLPPGVERPVLEEPPVNGGWWIRRRRGPLRRYRPLESCSGLGFVEIQRELMMAEQA